MSSAKNYPVSWFGLVQLPDLVAPGEALFQQMRGLHHKLFAALVAVAGLHIAGALKHHFIDRNDVLKRMLPFGGVK
jgi:cytochrome b561